MLDLLEKGAEINSKDNNGVSMTKLLTVDLISRISRKVLYRSLILLIIDFLKIAETSGNYILPQYLLFVFVSGLHCTWQPEKAVMTPWNALLSKELPSASQMIMGYGL